MESNGSTGRIFNAAWKTTAIMFIIALFVGVMVLIWARPMAPNSGSAVGGGMPEPSISVTGTGKVMVTPDSAELTLTVLGAGTEPSAANRQSTDKAIKVLQAVYELGIEERDVQTVQVQLNQKYDWIDGQQVDKGFEAQTGMVVKIRDLSMVDKLLTTVIDAGVSDVSGLQYVVSNRDAMYNQALSAAVQSAQSRATAVLPVGQELGKVLSVMETGPSYITPQYKNVNASYGADSAGASSGFAAGSQEIMAEVMVSFELK